MSKAGVGTLILGSTGYVGGELLRLLAVHPQVRSVRAVSRRNAGALVGQTFPHLEAAYRDVRFDAPDAVEAVLDAPGPLVAFSAMPHGESGGAIDALLRQARRFEKDVRVIDLSADLRLDADQYLEVYGRTHPAPQLLERFTCALPELTPGVPGTCMAHPGCFTTAVTLGAWPLLARSLAEPRLHVSAVTGSTGAGREPGPGTHHPFRHANLRGYQTLHHRHEPEMRRLLAGAGPREPEILFVPHSGPFARGIHATVFARLRRSMSGAELREAYRAAYATAPFVTVLEEPPAMKDVVGTNRCHLFAETRGQDAVVLAVIDNLVKGAAGGAVQWMNRMLGLEETAGLLLPALGWS